MYTRPFHYRPLALLIPYLHLQISPFLSGNEKVCCNNMAGLYLNKMLFFPLEVLTKAFAQTKGLV